MGSNKFYGFIFMSLIALSASAPTEESDAPPVQPEEVTEAVTVLEISDAGRAAVEEPIPIVTEPTTTEMSAVNLQESLRSLIDYQINEIVQLNEKRKQQGEEIINQVESFLTHVQNLKQKVSDLESYLRRLEQEAMPSSSMGSGPSALPLTSGGNHNTKAILYRRTNHDGSSTVLDFTECSRSSECCKNLLQYDNDTQSIDTKDTCVEMFKDRDCQGESRKYYPGTSYSHSDFGSFNDVYSSGKPCYV